MQIGAFHTNRVRHKYRAYFRNNISFVRWLNRSSVLTEGNEYEIINSERKDTCLGGSCSPKGAFGYATHIWKMRKSRAHLNLFTSETEFTPCVCLRTVLQIPFRCRAAIIKNKMTKMSGAEVEGVQFFLHFVEAISDGKVETHFSGWSTHKVEKFRVELV